jgi:hypothetical protein
VAERRLEEVEPRLEEVEPRLEAGAERRLAEAEPCLEMQQRPAVEALAEASAGARSPPTARSAELRQELLVFAAVA